MKYGETFTGWSSSISLRILTRMHLSCNKPQGNKIKNAFTDILLVKVFPGFNTKDMYDLMKELSFHTLILFFSRKLLFISTFSEI